VSYTYSRPATPEERRQGLRRHNTSISVGPGGGMSAIEWYDEEFAIPGTPLAPTLFLPMAAEPEPPPRLSQDMFAKLRAAMGAEGLAP
jgi:hypothetical protein